MALGYCNQMFNGKATAMPCTELKQRFPNLYMEPMQMNNSENKSYDTIPYMLINLDDVDTIYIGKTHQWHTSKVKMQAANIWRLMKS